MNAIHHSEPQLSSNGTSTGASPVPAYRPDPEVRATRRRYPLWYKLQVLKEADSCTQPGELGALLRREGLYHTTLTLFRRQRAEGRLELSGSATRRSSTTRHSSTQTSGGKSSSAQGNDLHGKAQLSPKADAKRVMALEQENRSLKRRLQQTEALVELQKKVAALLEVTMEGLSQGPGEKG